jgi:dephospho-CoA kinase
MIIGICGAKRSGKNTFAELIERELEQYTTTQASWADLVKQSAYYALGISKDKDYSGFHNVWADGFKQDHKINIVNSIGETIHTVTGREFLQLYGTEAHRDLFSENFWVDALWDKNDFSKFDFVFITDCRFDNEAESVKERGGIIVKVKNQQAESFSDTHDSESGISDSLVDIVIQNNGSLEELKTKAENFAERITNEQIRG